MTYKFLFGLLLASILLGHGGLVWSGDKVDFTDGKKVGGFGISYYDDSLLSSKSSGVYIDLAVVNQAGYTIDKLRVTKICFGMGGTRSSWVERSPYINEVASPTRVINLTSGNTAIFNG